jgi:hypothetical protein
MTSILDLEISMLIASGSAAQNFEPLTEGEASFASDCIPFGGNGDLFSARGLTA